MSETTPISVADAHAGLIAQHATLTEEMRETKASLASLMERRKTLNADLAELTRTLAFYERLKHPKSRRRNAE